MTHWKANDQNGEDAFQRLILCALFLPLFPSVAFSERWRTGAISESIQRQAV